MSLIVYSCNKEGNENNQNYQKEFNYLKDNVSIKYSSKILNNELSFNILIIDKTNDKSIDTSFNVSTDKLVLATQMSQKITSAQQELSDDFNLSEIEKFSSVMNSMIESVTNEMKNSELKDLNTQGVFMCNSLLKSIKRKIILNNNSLRFSNLARTNTNIEYFDASIYASNSVYEGFSRELSSFSLTEDLVLNVDNLENHINQNTVDAQSKGFLFVKEILNSLDTEYITTFELEQKIITFTLNNPNKFEGQVSSKGFKWASGSSHGCCGNYSGPCLYWHPVCYVHDVMCSDCTPRWFCFSGCRPD